MGIRINKVMGYGLLDIKTNKAGRITDSRFNKSFTQQMYDLNDFSTWLKNNNKEASIILATIFGYSAHQAKFNVRLMISLTFMKSLEDNDDSVIHFDPEYGLKNVIVLVPPDSNGWQRYDDIIDYVEHTDVKPKIVDLFKEKGLCGIYPHDHMTLIPGRKSFYKNNTKTLSPFDYKTYIGETAGISAVEKANIVKSLKEDWVPKIPETILLYSIYAKMFKDPLTVYQLRPMIYTYWS